ncbi:structural maintenance of chromosomes protein 5-like [Cajanus cajan]|uniref:structural maintenance of chromosomes protein 5-like n=1 Tax=Cajanus cajan TaxID=3821 RepID=UPI0010FB39D5|nr:structural maintenance of chromosomes protein 5-like [Cajanus cajan]
MTAVNAGKKFWGCPNYKFGDAEEQGCNFFKWSLEEYVDERDLLIARQRRKMNNLQSSLKSIRWKQKEEKAALDAKCKKVSSHINDNAKKRMELMEEENKLDVELRGKYTEMEELRRQEETQQQKLVKAREELAIAELELEEMVPYVAPKDELVSILMSLIISFTFLFKMFFIHYHYKYHAIS